MKANVCKLLKKGEICQISQSNPERHMLIWAAFPSKGCQIFLNISLKLVKRTKQSSFSKEAVHEGGHLLHPRKQYALVQAAHPLGACDLRNRRQGVSSSRAHHHAAPHHLQRKAHGGGSYGSKCTIEHAVLRRDLVAARHLQLRFSFIRACQVVLL